MDIVFEGDTDAVPLLVHELREQRLAVDCEPPLEYHAAGHDRATYVFIHIADGGERETTSAVVRDTIAKLISRYPRLKARFENDD